jgi:hypothetical protein
VDDNGVVMVMRQQEREQMLAESLDLLERTGRLLDHTAAQRDPSAPMTLEELFKEDDQNRASFEAMQSKSDIVRKAHTEPKPMTDAMRARQQTQADQRGWETWLRARLDDERKFLLGVVGEALGQFMQDHNTEVETLRARLKTLEAKTGTLEQASLTELRTLLAKIDKLDVSANNLQKTMTTFYAAHYEKDHPGPVDHHFKN